MRHGCYFRGTSVHGLFERGVVQMKGGKGGADFFATRDPPARVFALGGGSAVDATLDADVNVTTLLLSSASGSPYYSGVQRAVFAAYGPPYAAWDGGWRGKPTLAVAQGARYRTGMRLAPNNRNFPALALATGPNANGLQGDDLEAILTGIYGSAVGPLCTFDNGVVEGQRLAQASSSIHPPHRDHHNWAPPSRISISISIQPHDRRRRRSHGLTAATAREAGTPTTSGTRTTTSR